MKLYYTIYEDGDGWPQISEIAADPNKLAVFTFDSYAQYRSPRDIYVYDTNKEVVLTAESACNKTRYQKTTTPFELRRVSDEVNLLDMSHPLIKFNKEHNIVTFIEFSDKQSTLKFISLIAPSAEWIDKKHLKCTPEECWQIYCRFASKTNW